jgi:arylsulfatase A-like enzyme
MTKKVKSSVAALACHVLNRANIGTHLLVIVLLFIGTPVYSDTASAILPKDCRAASPAASAEPVGDALPNIVLVFTDDQGYADLGCFGGRGFQTPHLDRMAAEGTKFTSFYVAQAVCTASRAALMTGCYANRVSMSGALNHTSRIGIHPDEILLPEICKSQGYATAIFGKWHLGTLLEFGPLRNGFDEYLGIPYSNDNSKYHPILRDLPPLPLYDGEQVVEVDPDQSQFTRRFTERAVRFIEANGNRPFFLYVPHVMPHVPIFASEKFLGRTARGLYGDVIEELDWSVGEILAALRKCGLDDKTMVVFASDNGPFLSYGDHAGSASPFREGKLTTFEGGVRTPCIIRWPGRVPAGRVCDELILSIDLLPTIAALVGADLPPRESPAGTATESARSASPCTTSRRILAKRETSPKNIPISSPGSRSWRKPHAPIWVIRSPARREPASGRPRVSSGMVILKGKDPPNKDW